MKHFVAWVLACGFAAGAPVAAAKAEIPATTVKIPSRLFIFLLPSRGRSARFDPRPAHDVESSAARQDRRGYTGRGSAANGMEHAKCPSPS